MAHWPDRVPWRFIPARAGNTSGTVEPRSREAVHPRSRGEHPVEVAHDAGVDGSSPLARGTRDLDRHVGSDDRFIPARAGNTPPPVPRAPPPAVHPRSRGEHFAPATTTGDTTGSSPLARGTRLKAARVPRAVRFIPARAGNTRRPPIASTRRAVHPRSRGEHRARARRTARIDGSSPLARGTRAGWAARTRRSRFIPARAGNTVSPGCTFRWAAVHPRSRGEHEAVHQPPRIMLGSSPLARGTPDAPRRQCEAVRFIPARAGNTAGQQDRKPGAAVHPRSRGEHCPGRRERVPEPRFIPARAGNTPWSASRANPGSVHPRSRGEHVPRGGNWPLSAGSSPLARGTQYAGWRAHLSRRFIPARAGNTSSRSPSTRTAPVHPRSRGEHRTGKRDPGDGRGSSPLARGTRHLGNRAPVRLRFIPARAGNTT